MDSEIVRAALSFNYNAPSDSQAPINTQLSDILKKLSKKEMLSLIDKRCEQSNGDPKEYIAALFKGLSPETNQERRMEIMTRVVDLLIKSVLVDKKADDVIRFLNGELDTFLPGFFVGLCEKILESLQNDSSENPFNPKLLEFLPKSLELVSKLDTIEETKKTGQEFKAAFLENFFIYDWPKGAVISIITVLREIEMNEDQLKQAIEKIAKEIKHLDLQSMPAAIYQLLLLAQKGHQGLVLQAILDLVNNAEKSNQEEEATLKQLRQIEGTCVLHIDFSIKQDQALGTQFLKLLKQDIVWTPFNVAILLSMAKIQRFEERVFSLLKSTVNAYYRNSSKTARWIEVLPAMQARKSVEKILIQTVKASSHGWDNIIQPLVQFGFILVDSAANKSDIATKGVLELGQSILLETFKIHQIVRSEIFEQIMSRIATMSTTSPTPYINLLSKIISENPKTTLDYVQKLKEYFDYLSQIQPVAAEGLLTAVEPILAIHAPFQDHVILVLKKAMFNRELESRVTAVTGFLIILRSLSNSNSNRNSDQEKDIFEILSFLKRCLTQQAEVRQKLYYGLVELLIAKPSLYEPICDLLLNQFLRYYEVNESQACPLHIERSLEKGGNDSVRVVEPLPHLLAAIASCICVKDSQSSEEMELDKDNSLSDSFTLLKKHFETMISRILNTDLREFELDKGIDFSGDTPQGKYNSQTANMLLGVYEASFNYVALSPKEHNEETVKTCVQVFILIQDLMNMLKPQVKPKGSKGTGGKKGKNKTDDGDPDASNSNTNNKDMESGGKTKSTKKGSSKSVMKERISVLTLPAISRIFTIMHLDEADPLRLILRNSADFQFFMIQNCHQLLSELSERETTIVVSELHNRNLQTLMELANPTMKEFMQNNYWSESDQKKKDLKKSVELSAESFELILNTVIRNFDEKKIAQVLKNSITITIEDSKKNDPKAVISVVMDTLQAMVTELITKTTEQYNENEKPPKEKLNWKEIAQVIKMIGDLSPFIPEERLQEIASNWLDDICQYPIVDGPLAKSLVKLYLLFTGGKSTNSNRDMRLAFAKDIHALYGNTDHNAPDVNYEIRYKMINIFTVQSILPLLLGSIDSILTEGEVAIDNLKVSAVVMASMEEDETEGENIPTLSHVRNAIYTRLMTAVHVLAVIASTKFKGSDDALTLKTVAKAYKVLTLATKELIESSSIPSPKFEKLCDIGGIELGPNVLHFITYVESIDMEDLQEREFTSKARVSRESKVAPAVIFEMEKWESVLMKLGKAVKMDLMRKFKRTTARDFKLKNLEDALPNVQPQKKVSKKRASETAPKEPKQKKTKQDPKEKKTKKPKKKKDNEDEDGKMEEDSEEQVLTIKKRKS